ncbi:16651_t:CDS:2, partial [Racocetra persica]
KYEKRRREINEMERESEERLRKGEVERQRELNARIEKIYRESDESQKNEELLQGDENNAESEFDKDYRKVKQEVIKQIKESAKNLLVHDGEFRFEYEDENLVDYGKFHCFNGFTDKEQQEISYALKFQANTE